MDFNLTLPIIKNSAIFSKPSINTYNIFYKPVSTFLPTYSLMRINKNWKIKTGMQYQYNALRKRWEWIPQVSVSYEW